MINCLPPFTIENIEATDLLEDLGEDVVFFDIHILLEGEIYCTTIPLRKLVKYAEEHHPAEGAYLQKIRDNMKGFGPKETKVLKIINDEEFDLKPLIYSFIDNVIPIEHLERADKWTTEHTRETAEEIADVLCDLGAEQKSFSIREIAFSDALMDYLTNAVADIYPEIFNSQPEFITELNEILTRGVMDISESLNDLAWNAANDGED